LIAKDAHELEIQFTVGGAMTINSVDIWYAKWDDIPRDQLNCISQPTSTDGFQKGTIVGETNGTGYFSLTGSQPRQSSASEVEKMTFGPMFKAKIMVPPDLKTLDQLVVLASARVDQDWAERRENIKPDIPPQSHVVNARTNPDWHHESAGKHVKGRLDWFSDPVTIVIGDFSEGVGTHGDDGIIRIVEMYPRFSEGAGNSGLKPKSASDEQLWFPVHIWYVFAGLLVLMALCLGCIMRRRKKERTNTSNGRYDGEDSFTFESKPYSDVYDDEDDDMEDENELHNGVELPTLA